MNQSCLDFIKHYSKQCTNWLQYTCSYGISYVKSKYRQYKYSPITDEEMKTFHEENVSYQGQSILPDFIQLNQELSGEEQMGVRYQNCMQSEILQSSVSNQFIPCLSSSKLTSLQDTNIDDLFETCNSNSSNMDSSNMEYSIESSMDSITKQSMVEV